MKKILSTTAILAFLVMLTGCGEQENSHVINVYGSTANGTPNAAPVQDRVQSEVNENALPEQTLEPSELLEPSASPEPAAFSVPQTVDESPRDLASDDAYDAFDALLAIVETAQTVEILNEKIAEFNEEYPSYAVTGVEITHYGEPVTTGLLKNGMSIRILYNGDGWLECAVVRAPKDIIPD
ncbi:MAG: hypothetical protein HDT43_10295 [Ruminococcaceae bacterium]|nr:hypothetical protein [Oscillospiraceae bacterium]